jgi:hypothetical protein
MRRTKRIEIIFIIKNLRIPRKNNAKKIEYLSLDYFIDNIRCLMLLTKIYELFNSYIDEE